MKLYHVKLSLQTGRIRHKLISAFLSLFVIYNVPVNATTTDKAASNKDFWTKELNVFVNDVAEQHELPISYIKKALESATLNPTVLEKIQTPWEKKPWHVYRNIFIKPERIHKGVAFWQEQERWLQKAEQEYGVPSHIIVSILAVESYFGKHLGQYPVLDSLYSLGFHYPNKKRNRSKFFRSELGHFLKLSYQQQFNPTEIKGSYAGAMGWGQFIASSYRGYAVDFDNDGQANLFNSPADAIGSVANYFKKNGWKKNASISVPLPQLDASYNKYLDKTVKKPKHTFSTLFEADSPVVTANQNLLDINANEKVKLMRFAQPEGFDYWLGLHNFYVITRYNHSNLYALAVFQLSEKIKQEYDRLI
ncbi:lytic murein transglycosylase B [Flocculibacter collagenilyticus]|uniref:lytic murein transglycosylase B n=1 Tax=Flocculibacter collagenilyticus TaxID=2744479 RepID=UPI0018F42307|nr:lytic murein transglycosylase B [Flocculibacter collagenilyticus]